MNTTENFFIFIFQWYFVYTIVLLLLCCCGVVLLKQICNRKCKKSILKNNQTFLFFLQIYLMKKFGITGLHAYVSYYIT